ncbi:programmed cell death protein 2 [Chytriomyces sp. MP71]|nr:programmed cell death protein 2 [Chytriomyces sp. MP71]
MPPITLGFVEHDHGGESLHPDDISLADDIPHKVGGRPLWLRRDSPLESDRVSCKRCGDVMSMLVQLYTPDDAIRHAFHRMLYLFACKNGTCKSFKIFRSQLPEDNPHWPVNNPPSANPAPLCHTCGLKGSKICTGCRAVHYCSKQHQAFDWKFGKHDTSCGALSTTTAPRRTPKQSGFSEWEIVTEPEPSAMAAATLDDVTGNLSGIEMSDPIADGEEVDPEDDRLAEDTEVDVDPAFLKFQKRVARESEQVIRWDRDGADVAVSMDVDGEEDDDEPEVAKEEAGVDRVLWASDSDKPDWELDVGGCRHCGKPRLFEFQVMPQLLNHLAIDHASPTAFDFGIIVVFTCLDRCQPTDAQGVPLPYMEEAAIHQSFSERGLNDRMRHVGMGTQDVEVEQPQRQEAIDEED